MRSIGWVLLGAMALAGCHKPAAFTGSPLSFAAKDGAWSERQALEGPMAVWGPPGVGREVLSITCLPRPRRAVIISLFAPFGRGRPMTGDLRVRADGRPLAFPLSAKDEGTAEARAPVGDPLLAAWESADDLRFELASSPGAGADVGAPTPALKRVLAACR